MLNLVLLYTFFLFQKGQSHLMNFYLAARVLLGCRGQFIVVMQLVWYWYWLASNTGRWCCLYGCCCSPSSRAGCCWFCCLTPKGGSCWSSPKHCCCCWFCSRGWFSCWLWPGSNKGCWSCWLSPEGGCFDCRCWQSPSRGCSSCWCFWLQTGTDCCQRTLLMSASGCPENCLL